MDILYPASNAPATPEFVLAVIKDPEADPDVVLSLDTTIAGWRDACDLLGWRALGRAHNQLWGISCSDGEWRNALEPADQRRLADVCRLIAARTARPVIRPAHILGSLCGPAGAFLTIRSLLHEAGAQAGEINPSTPLAPYTRTFAGVFLGPVSRLAPGTLPPVRIQTPVYDAAVYAVGWSLLVGLIGVIVGAWIGMPLLSAAGVVMFALSYAFAWYAAACVPPATVEFGDLRTFRDLAVLMAAGRTSEVA